MQITWSICLLVIVFHIFKFLTSVTLSDYQTSDKCAVAAFMPFTYSSSVEGEMLTAVSLLNMIVKFVCVNRQWAAFVVIRQRPTIMVLGHLKTRIHQLISQLD